MSALENVYYRFGHHYKWPPPEIVHLFIYERDSLWVSPWIIPSTDSFQKIIQVNPWIINWFFQKLIHSGTKHHYFITIMLLFYNVALFLHCLDFAFICVAKIHYNIVSKLLNINFWCIQLLYKSSVTLTVVHLNVSEY